MCDLARYTREKNNIYGLNELPLRSCYYIDEFIEKKNEYGKRYYYCHTRDVNTGEKINLWSNCYLTQEIDRFRELEIEDKSIINFMITRRKANRYGGVISFVYVIYQPK